MFRDGLVQKARAAEIQEAGIRERGGILDKLSWRLPRLAEASITPDAYGCVCELYAPPGAPLAGPCEVGIYGRGTYVTQSSAMYGWWPVASNERVVDVIRRVVVERGWGNGERPVTIKVGFSFWSTIADLHVVPGGAPTTPTLEARIAELERAVARLDARTTGSIHLG